MNDRDQENEEWRGPLIFTVPAYGFVMAFYLDWLAQSTRAACSAKTLAQEVEPTDPVIQAQEPGQLTLRQLFCAVSSFDLRQRILDDDEYDGRSLT